MNMLRCYDCRTTILAHKDAGLDQLTSLRFFAALMIVAAHTFGFLWLSRIENPALVNGVSFFFVLSGFIMAYSYHSLSGRI